MEYTEQERIWQWCDTHQELLMQYFRAHAKDASQIELVSYNSDKMNGVLTVFNWQGVRKIVAVTPESLIENLSELVDVIERRCIEASEAAESAATYANAQGDDAKAEANRVRELLTQLNALMETVRQQGNTAAAQGAAAEAIKNEVTTWYSPFKLAADSWYSAITANVSSWFSNVQSDWISWFEARKAEWNTWFDNTSTAWGNWFEARKAEWNTWYGNTTSTWSQWYNDTRDVWTAWFQARVDDWAGWYQKFQLWEQKEEQRQSAEQIRLEYAAHPPIPSERGYWMFWDITNHEYVESGYSSRGTMDWPEFFWDYDSMGIGVITSRDYSRFFIDEQGRFGMLM